MSARFSNRVSRGLPPNPQKLLFVDERCRDLRILTRFCDGLRLSAAATAPRTASQLL